MKTVYGDIGELIVGELQQHGRLPLSLVISNVVEHSKQAGSGYAESSVKEVFAQLVDGHFLQRSTWCDSDGDEDENNSEQLQFVLPPEGMKAPKLQACYV